MNDNTQSCMVDGNPIVTPANGVTMKDAPTVYEAEILPSDKCLRDSPCEVTASLNGKVLGTTRYDSIVTASNELFIGNTSTNSVGKKWVDRMDKITPLADLEGFKPNIDCHPKNPSANSILSQKMSKKKRGGHKLEKTYRNNLSRATNNEVTDPWPGNRKTDCMEVWYEIKPTGERQQKTLNHSVKSRPKDKKENGEGKHWQIFLYGYDRVCERWTENHILSRYFKANFTKYPDHIHPTAYELAGKLAGMDDALKPEVLREKNIGEFFRWAWTNDGEVQKIALQCPGELKWAVFDANELIKHFQLVLDPIPTSNGRVAFYQTTNLWGVTKSGRAPRPRSVFTLEVRHGHNSDNIGELKLYANMENCFSSLMEAKVPHSIV